MCNTLEVLRPWMPQVVAISNRKLCPGEALLPQLEKILPLRPAALYLREKDLDEEEYASLAQEVWQRCCHWQVPLMLCERPQLAAAMPQCGLHLPWHRGVQLQRENPELLQRLPAFSVSCHSLEEVQKAAEMGCTSLILGTIFPTSCKPGHPGNGVDFLQECCRNTTLPVYAIGGITPQRMPQVLAAGAAGGAMMSQLMTCGGC